MAIEIAEAVVGALKGELAATAVNAPMVPAEVNISTHFPTGPGSAITDLCSSKIC